MELSRLIGLSYSTAYEELRQMEKAGLAQSLHQGRQVKYSARLDHPQAKLLEELLKAPHFSLTELAPQVTDEEKVRSNLSRVGAPLGGQFDSREEMSLEETLCEGLRLARRDATVARVLPVAFYKNWRKLDRPKLIELATLAGEKKALGFFLELTGLLSGNSQLKKVALKLKDRRVRRNESFFVYPKRGAFQARLEVRNTPRIASRWHFTMNMGLDSFESLFRKFVS